MRIKYFVYIISMVFVIVLCGSLWVNAATYEGYIYDISNNMVTIIGFDNSIAGEIVVPQEIEGYSVMAIGELAFYDCDKITKVELPNTIRVIGKGAFSNCNNLESITISNNLTKIGDSAFSSCSKLINVFIPASVVRIGNLAFEHCNAIQSFTVDENNEFYSSIDGCLYNKDKSILIQYPVGKNESSFTLPESVKTIECCAFYGCNLKKISFNANLRVIKERAFCNSVVLKCLFFQKYIQLIEENAFLNCYCLEEVFFFGAEQLWNNVIVEEGNRYIKENLKCISEGYTKTTITENGENVTIVPYNISTGATVIFAQYLNNRLVNVNSEKYYSENISFKTEKMYDSAKIMVWDDFKPQVECENIRTSQVFNQQYGYIMQARIKKEALDEYLIFNMMTQTGSKTSYHAYEKTKVNGKTYSSYSELLEALEDTALPSGSSAYPEDTDYAVHSQLVKYTTKSYNGQKVIDEIITVTDDATSGSDVNFDELLFYKTMNASDALTYSSTNKQLVGSKKININSAIIYKIPEDRSDVDKYKKMSLSDFRNGEKYHAEFYDVSSTNSAKVVLVYGGAANAGEVNAESPVMVITDIATEEDPSGENATRYRLYGYVGSTEVDYWGSTDSDEVFETLQAGDVVRLGTDDDGYYTVKEEYIIFSVDEGFRDTAIGQEPDKGEYPKSEDGSTGSVAYKVIWGSAYQRDDDLLVVTTENILAGDEAEDEIGDTYTMQRSWFKNAKIYEFDTTGRDLEVTEYDTADNTSVIDGLDLYDGSSQPAEVFIHMTSNSKVQTVIVVVR